MIEVYYDQGEMAFYLSVKGHAGHSTKGTDIVCAGVSTLAYTLAEFLSVEDFDTPLKLSFPEGGAEIECIATEDNVVRVQAAFDYAMIGLQTLAREYPNNVVVNGE